MRFFFNGLVAIGILFGILFVLAFEFYTDILGGSIEPSGELIAAILGASIGWAGTVLTIHAAIEAKNDEQLTRDQAVAVEIFVKFRAMINHFYHFRQHIREAYGSVDPRSHANPGLFLLGLANSLDLIKFTSEEQALFIRRKKTEVANDIAEWDGIHNSLLRAFEKYSRLREEFMSFTPARMEGNVGTTEMEEAEFARFAPKIAILNNLAEQMKYRSDEDYPKCKAALMRVKAEMEALCGLKIDLSVPD